MCLQYCHCQVLLQYTTILYIPGMTSTSPYMAISPIFQAHHALEWFPGIAQHCVCVGGWGLPWKAQRQASVPTPSLEKPATSPAIPAARPFRWFNAFRTMGDDAKENYNQTFAVLLVQAPGSFWNGLHGYTAIPGPILQPTQVPTAGSRPLGEVRPASGRAIGCVPSPRSARRSLDLLTMICR